MHCFGLTKFYFNLSHKAPNLGLTSVNRSMPPICLNDVCNIKYFYNLCKLFFCNISTKST